MCAAEPLPRVPQFRSFVDTAELDQARKDLAKERAGRIEAEANAMRIAGRLKKIEQALAAETEKAAAATAAAAAANAAAAAAAASKARADEGGASASAAWKTLLQPSVGDKRKSQQHHEERSNDAYDDYHVGGDGRQRTVLKMFDPNRNDADAEERRAAAAAAAAAAKEAEEERRHDASMHGRYVPRHVARVRGRGFTRDVLHSFESFCSFALSRREGFDHTEKTPKWYVRGRLSRLLGR